VLTSINSKRITGTDFKTFKNTTQLSIFPISCIIIIIIIENHLLTCSNTLGGSDRTHEVLHVGRNTHSCKSVRSDGTSLSSTSSELIEEFLGLLSNGLDHKLSSSELRL